MSRRPPGLMLVVAVGLVGGCRSGEVTPTSDAATGATRAEAAELLATGGPAGRLDEIDGTLDDLNALTPDYANEMTVLAGVRDGLGVAADDLNALTNAIARRELSQDVYAHLANLVSNDRPDELRELIAELDRREFGAWGFGPLRIIDETAPVDLPAIAPDLDPVELDNVRAVPSQPDHRMLIGRNQIVPISFLARGQRRHPAVGHVTTTSRRPDGDFDKGEATCFLIAPDLVLTNRHVLPRRSVVRFRRVFFDYDDADGAYDDAEMWTLDGSVYVASDRYDYAVVRATPAVPAPRVRPPIRLRPDVTYLPEMRVNIIQHPWGMSKRLAIQENRLVSIQPEGRLRYLTDTMVGSSGSPLFDNEWRLIGLHRATDPKPVGGVYRYNEGVRIDIILRDLLRRPDCPASLTAWLGPELVEALKGPPGQDEPGDVH